ncbi:hypothetical protein LJE71_05850, partial [Xanthobacter autotrophicus]
AQGAGNGAGRRDGQNRSGEGRGARPQGEGRGGERGGERGARPGNDLGGLGFMKAVSNRSERPAGRPAGAKRPVN